MHKKQFYSAPETEVLELRLEGVIATSDPDKLRGGLGVESYSGFDGETEI